MNKKLKKIQSYRKKMKALDSELFSLLKKRILLSQKIMKYKKQVGQKIIDQAREAEIEQQLLKKLKKLTTTARANAFIKKLMKLNCLYP